MTSRRLAAYSLAKMVSGDPQSKGLMKRRPGLMALD